MEVAKTGAKNGKEASFVCLFKVVLTSAVKS